MTELWVEFGEADGWGKGEDTGHELEGYCRSPDEKSCTTIVAVDMERSRWVGEIKKKTQVIGRGGRLTGRHQGWCPGNGAVTELGNPAGDWKPAGDEERLFTP